MYVYPAKSSKFEWTDFASVMIDDVGCSRRHQCPRCELDAWPLQATCVPGTFCEKSLVKDLFFFWSL